MDNSHVALVAVKLEAAGFKRYRCDRPMPLGVNLGSLTKVLKCAKDDDVCTLKAGDEADVLNLVYEAKREFSSASFEILRVYPSSNTGSFFLDSDRIAEYDMKLMDIDSDTLGIPDTDYDARVTMPSSEFTRIVRDLSQLGESVRIEVNKEGVRFASDGESANGSVLLKQTEAARALYENYGKDEEGSDEEEKNEEEDDDNDDDEVKKEKKIKKEKTKTTKAPVKKEAEGEGDVEMDDDEKDEEEKGEEEFKPKSDGEDDDEEDEEVNKKKRKKAPVKVRVCVLMIRPFR